MLRQLGLFSLVLTLVMVGFAATFTALYGADTVLVEANDPVTCDVNGHPVVFAFGTLGGALLTLFSSMLGEFNFEVFYERYEGSDGEDCGGVIYVEGGVVLYVMFLIITSITLLNLLIAVLSTAHAEVDQNASKVGSSPILARPIRADSRLVGTLADHEQHRCLLLRAQRKTAELVG